jgi:hypothetical protein
MRGTVVEMPQAAEQTAAAPASTALDVVQGTVAETTQEPHARTAKSRRSEAATDAIPRVEPGPRFLLRLLLPEGDRRTVEVGRRGVSLGSGLDEIGLPGDPRVGGAEARLWVENDKLCVEAAAGAANIYRRIDHEERLTDGDVVLMGDVAAMFVRVDPGPAVDGSRQVLGGSANAPCGRLVFLRRDGSPGPVHDLPAGKTVLGRTDGHINFPHDSRLSRRHVLFFASDQGVTVEDMESRNGTYLRLRGRRDLHIDDSLRIGSSGLQVKGRA